MRRCRNLRIGGLIMFLVGVSFAAVYFYPSNTMFVKKMQPSIQIKTIDRQFDVQRNHLAYDHVDTILLFIGYPRSRHTLVSGLLDAHPNIMLSNELGLINMYHSHPEWTKTDIYDKIAGNSFRQATTGERSKRLNGTAQDYVKVGYQVPGQWQGTFDDPLKILGNKMGWATAAVLANDVGREALRQMERDYHVKAKFIHVIRNPFDNISTLAMRLVTLRKEEHTEKHNIPQQINSSIRYYFAMARRCQVAKEFLGDRVLDVRGEDFVQQPVEHLRRICGFLEITCSEQYLQDCASIVDPVPSVTRSLVVWTKEQIETVNSLMRPIDFLHSYSFES